MNDDLPLAGHVALLLTAAGVALGVLAASGVAYVLLKLDSKLANRR